MMETDLTRAWGDGLYWICMKYDLDPEDFEVRQLIEEIYEAGWSDGNSWVVFDE